MELEEIIIHKIKNEGPISFCQFMEYCLYYPNLGYYTSSTEKIGINGDYYTATSLTSVFGAMIGRQLENMWQTMGKGSFTVVEYGAGTGCLCRDIIKYLMSNPKMFDDLQYFIIEKSPVMRALEKHHLSDFDIQWIDDITEIAGFKGCVLSNELLDNFSVHQLLMGKELQEIYLDYKNGFEEVFFSANVQLANYLSELGIVLPNGFRTEINLQAIQWIKELAAAMQEGYVLTIDYGYLSEELYHPQRSNGTLICYHKHSINEQFYNNIGKQDITAHVNFSALQHWGAKYGLVNCQYTNLGQFLLALGIKEYIEVNLANEKDIVSAARKASFLNHTLLMDMGTKFNVLMQRKSNY